MRQVSPRQGFDAPDDTSIAMLPPAISRCGGATEFTLAQYIHCTYNSNMADLRIEWDRRKAAANKRKHGVAFEEAATAFADEYGRVIPDPDHSEEEDRLVLLGMSWSLRILVVCHCHREASDVIRIISARKATRSERAQYRAG